MIKIEIKQEKTEIKWKNRNKKQKSEENQK